MEPSDDDADTFFDEIFTMKMESKMAKIAQESLESNHDQMRYENHNDRHTKSSIDISIDRTKIVMKTREESENPIKKETIEVRTKDVDKHTSNKPETLTQWEIMTKKWLKKSLHMLHNKEACCMDKTRLAPTSQKENSRTNGYNNNKNPGRKHSVCHIW